jgi:Uma2 family endonuclease
MNIRPELRMGKAAFLAWGAGREERYELADGHVVMMTGGSRAHAQIISNLTRILGGRLDPDKWMILSDFGIEIGAETLRYPDIVVDSASEAPRDLTASAPILIAEVLSPSTERTDLGDKAAEYLRLPSLVAYLVLAQDEMKAWVWMRDADGFQGGPQVLTAPATVRVAALELELPLAEVYARIKLA